jgi:hypothetical protein
MAVGHATAQTVGCIPLTLDVCLQTQATPRGIDGGQSEAETGSSLSSLVFPLSLSFHQGPRLLIFLSLTLCNVSS